MAAERRLRVVVLGGGMGGLATAWALASEPDSERRYEIRVFERSARLGGKGASARERAQHQRVLEHGLHVLMGFYHESLRLLRTVYEEVERTHPGKTLAWRDALLPWDGVVMADPGSAGEWGFWNLSMPPNGREPGANGPSSPSAESLVDRAAAWFRRLRDETYRELHLAPPPGKPGEPVPFTPETAGAVREEIERGLRELAELLRPKPAEGFAFARRAWIAAWFVGTNVVGAIDCGVPSGGFDQAGDADYRAWLQRYTPGWLPRRLTVESPPVDALYDLAFSHGRTLGAGTTLRVVAHMLLDYEGHLAYKLNGGMGDVVFAPLFLALSDRSNVSVHLQHEVTEVTPTAQGDAIEQVRIRRAEAVPTGAELDSPECLQNKAGGLHVWPEPPTLEIRVPEDAEIELRAGEDFDVAVLAIPVGALLPACKPLALASRPFLDMAVGIATTPTQALQLWVAHDAQTLGWPQGRSMLISYARPFNSWVDMSHVTGLECWASPEPQMLAYFCDALPDADVAGRDPQQVVDTNADRFIAGPLRTLWPRFQAADVVSRYTRANVDPSDRYVLAEAGTLHLRMAPDGSGFRNLALAGDWVRTRYNAGCLEAAVLSGLAAAEAIRTGRVRG